MAELDGTGTLAKSFVWGQDVSGTMQGAGGIGGLLFFNDASGNYQAGYDGNGNLTTLVKAIDGTIAANYEYDAFGNTLRTTGEAASKNPFQFSTKYVDGETGLLYYGYRYYQPQTGRWVGRDPMAEEESINLYGFIGNNSLSYLDPLGLALYAFDGTGNDKKVDTMAGKTGNGPTNVAILHDLYDGLKYYVNGVGTREVGVINEYDGLYNGNGGQDRLQRMLKYLCEAIIKKDTTLDITGFSRGAASGRDFANKALKLHPKDNLKIRWLGIFDTVDQFGDSASYELRIPDEVETVYHLTAQGETRYGFPLTSILTSAGAAPRKKSWQEIALAGVHSDVGGSYKDNQFLSNIALKLMHQNGLNNGVPFKDIPKEYKNKPGDKALIHDQRFFTDKIRDAVYYVTPAKAPAERRIFYR